MTHTFRSLFSFVTALLLWICTVPAQADGLHWRYVSLDQATLPPPFVFFNPSDISDDGSVVGFVCDSTCTVTSIGIFKDGKVTLLPGLPSGSLLFSGPINARGTVGFSILDPVTFLGPAALFRNGKVEIIPPQPGESSASVLGLNDNDTAIVESFDANFNSTFVLYSDGKAAPINFPSIIMNPFFGFGGVCKCINNERTIEGIAFNQGIFTDARGFRFNPPKGIAMLLNTFPGDPTETLAWGQAINEGGDVLGYSFVSKPPYHERIGLWDNKGTFHTYFVENVSSNRLLFNDDKLIVITEFFNPPPRVSYFVPEPGVRLNLADLVVNLPVGQDLFLITGLNNQGDMIGVSSGGGNFLLQRLDDEEASSRSFARPVVQKTRAIPPVMAAIQRRLHPQFDKLK